jgi:hypothetical protein
MRKNTSCSIKMSIVIPKLTDESKLPPKEEWGPAFWYVMKVVALGLGDRLSEDLKTETYHFYHSLASMIPGPDCRAHYLYLFETELPFQNVLGNNNDASGESILSWVNKVEQSVKQFIRAKQVKQEQVIQPINADRLLGQPSINSNTKNALIHTVSKSSKSTKSNKSSLKAMKPPSAGVSRKTSSRKTTASATRLTISAKNYKRPCSC